MQTGQSDQWARFTAVPPQGHVPHTSSQAGSPIPAELEATGGHSHVSTRLTSTVTQPGLAGWCQQGESTGEDPEEGWDVPCSLMHKHNRLSRALLLTPVNSHTLVCWERQPRALSRQQGQATTIRGTT